MYPVCNVHRVQYVRRYKGQGGKYSVLYAQSTNHIAEGTVNG